MPRLFNPLKESEFYLKEALEKEKVHSEQIIPDVLKPESCRVCRRKIWIVDIQQFNKI